MENLVKTLDYFYCILSSFDKFTGFINLALCIATWALWFHTTKLVDNGLDNTKRTIRAYVAAERLEAYVDTSNNGERNYRLRVLWSNSGSTPATDLSVFMEKRIVERDKSAPRVSFDDMSKTRPGFIAPKVASVAGSILLERDEIEKIGKGKRMVINVYWGVSYKDIYNECHVTRQSWQIIDLGDPERWEPNKNIHIDAVPIAGDDLNYMSDGCGK